MEELNELYKVIQPDFLIKAIGDSTGVTNFDIIAELGFMDDLDYIEIIMAIEKEYSIHINDATFEEIDRIGFNVVYSNLISVKRDEYLGMIGIEDVK
jgi:acyl carrier protein